MTHHPDRQNLGPENIHKKCQNLVETIFCRLWETHNEPRNLFSELKSLGRSAHPKNGMWFQEFEDAYDHYKHVAKLEKRDGILSPHIVGNSLVDIGCGGGDQAADLKARHPEVLKRVAGIDILDWKTKGLDIDYHILDFSKPGTTSSDIYDTGMLLAVLHHVGSNEQKILTFLEGVKTAVSHRLIVEEDVILTPQDLQRTDINGMTSINTVRKNQPIFDEYLDQNAKTQKDILILIDLLGNSLSVGVPDMPFPFGFRTFSDWVDIFFKSGFSLNEIKILGFQKGNFNQSCHVLFILDKPML